MTVHREFVVYLSSTLADLKEERDLALKTIAEVGVVRTTYRADEKAPPAACTADVRGSHLYVGILGQRYGYVPPKEEGNPALKSITELEYDACRAPELRDPVPRLVFVKPTQAGIPAEHIDALSHPETAARMKEFLERAGREQTPCVFANLEEFRAELRIRVKEHADRFHRAAAGDRGMFAGGETWKRQLAPVAVGCVPGTDAAEQAALARLGGGRITAFEASPDDPAYLATVDAGFARAQLGALLVTPASLGRLAAAADVVADALETLAERTGHAVLVAAGVDAAALPPAFGRAEVVPLAAGTLTGPDAAATVAALHDRLRAIDGTLTLEPRLPLPYVVIAPTLDEALELADPASKLFDRYGAGAAPLRRGEFEHIRDAVRAADAKWPSDLYDKTRREAWRCFGTKSADEIIRATVADINAAPAGSRERRFLKSARLVPRRYGLDEYLRDRRGSRRAVEAARDAGCLFIVDELALLHPALRQAADDLLVGPHSAIVAVTPCDPAHTPTDALLGDLSYLKVGSVLTRFKNERDPGCEIALNCVRRVERWLRATIPELVVSADDQASVPSLVEAMEKSLAA